MACSTENFIFNDPVPVVKDTRGVSGQDRSGRVRKISVPPGFDPRTAQPVASRYTYYAIPTHVCYTSVKVCFGTVDFIK